jgi:dolichyl-phosphate-mannose-protein mannosyltransferase
VVSQLDLTPAATAPTGRRRPPAPARPGGASRSLIALVLIVIALSAVVRLVDLDVFPTLVFDEHYYVHDAGSAVHGRLGPRRPSPWKPGDERSLAHPPLGTLAIAAGIVALGNDPWGWRVPSAIAGTLLIALVYPLARRLRLAPVWAFVALLLAASDTMLIVESRLGVLDPFVAFWSTACIYCALRYVQSGRPARWLVACGATGGLALASKWSGVLALAAAAAICGVYWVRERRRVSAGDANGDVSAAGGDASGAREAGGAGSGIAIRLARPLVCLVVLPFVVYVVSYADYFASGHTVRQWLHLQGYMASFNWHVKGMSTMASRPLTWIFDATPIWYRWTEGAHGVVGMIAIGNPLLWWGSIAAVVGLLLAAWRRRDARLAVAPLLVCVLYLPWLATSRETYIYYLTPVVPFLAVAVATGLARLAGPVAPRGRWAAAAFAAGALFMGLVAGGTLPIRLAALAGVVAAAVLIVVVARHRAPTAAETPARPAAVVAWLYTGAVAGLAVAWLPFLVSYAVSYGYYERLTWLATWR